MRITKDGKKYDNKPGIPLTREEFIKKIEQTHGTIYTYDKLNYINSATKVILTCKDHGDFECIPNTVTTYEGWPCYECKRENSFNNFVKRSNEIYGDKYEYDIKNYNMGYKPMKMLCKVHGIFESTPDDHLHLIGSSCKECKKEIINNKILEKLKNNPKYINYDFTNTKIIDYNNDIDIFCKKHQKTFTRRLGYILKHDKNIEICPICQKEAKLENFIKKSRSLHNIKYDYSDIKDFNSVDKLPIICHEHGKFYQTSTEHLRQKNSCPICTGGIKLIKDKESFIKEANNIHGDLYDYSLVKYFNVKTAVQIICRYHGPFWQTPQNHIYLKNGCPNCTKSKQVSKEEIKWLNSLLIPIRNIVLEGYNVDGFDPKTNTIYEYLGDYWHGNLSIQKAEDMNKTVGKTFGELNKETFERIDYLKSKGYNVIYIWESDWLKRNNCL